MTGIPRESRWEQDLTKVQFVPPAPPAPAPSSLSHSEDCMQCIRRGFRACDSSSSRRRHRCGGRSSNSWIGIGAGTIGYRCRCWWGCRRLSGTRRGWWWWVHVGVSSRQNRGRGRSHTECVLGGMIWRGNGGRSSHNTSVDGCNGRWRSRGC